MDYADFSTDYPFKCDSVIHTGHRANIFNAQMLPFSSRIATVAGDNQVRIFDIGSANALSSGSETVHATQDACVRVIRCHSKRTKRIVVEESSDIFLTVAEVSSTLETDKLGYQGCILLRIAQCASTICESHSTYVTGESAPHLS